MPFLGRRRAVRGRFLPADNRETITERWSHRAFFELGSVEHIQSLPAGQPEVAVGANQLGVERAGARFYGVDLILLGIVAVHPASQATAGQPSTLT